jgi:hypothetical protein
MKSEVRLCVCVYVHLYIIFDYQHHTHTHTPQVRKYTKQHELDELHMRKQQEKMIDLDAEMRKLRDITSLRTTRTHDHHAKRPRAQRGASYEGERG